MAADFRPIACTNVIYKTITKIIASRMIPCLPGLIDPAQGAFVDGRLMLDNVFLAQELIKGYSRKHMSPRSMIKVDLRKAYDTISWNFLEKVLLTIGFPYR
ncbi:reverse transcriptase domain-containing protein, partial [Escherichia coli]|uniref:reverse transcriptase domain-containing protein n=1 Tax=Escherichia coli TaxID=562 RepID=UPI00178C56C2